MINNEPAWRVRPGRRIGPYCVYATLGRGSSAEVYEAEHLSLDRQVALKILPPGDGVSRFLEEARLFARLSHPGLVKIFDCELLPDGGAYLAMELLHGQLLSQRLRRQRPLLLVEVVDIIGQLAAALEVLHDSGLVHRGVEPDHVMLCGDRVKLLDSRAEVATPYSAPEAEIDRRADVYSLGALLLEMAKNPPPILSRVAATAMSPSPDDRYPGTLAMMAALAGTDPD